MEYCCLFEDIPHWWSCREEASQLTCRASRLAGFGSMRAATESNSAGINLIFISAINVMVLFFFYFMFVVSAVQDIKKLDSNWFYYPF